MNESDKSSRGKKTHNTQILETTGGEEEEGGGEKSKKDKGSAECSVYLYI